MKSCPVCEQELAPGATQCHVCGKVVLGMQPCEACGQLLESGTLLCPFCDSVQHGPKSRTRLHPNIVAALMLGAMVLLAGLGYVALQSANPRQRARQEPNRGALAVRPTYELLAVLDARTPVPPAHLVRDFRAAFSQLERACSEKGERLGDMLVAGHRASGPRASLLEFTQSVAAVASGPLDHGESCAADITLVAMDYRSGLR